MKFNVSVGEKVADFCKTDIEFGKMLSRFIANKK
jgi:hypothetical protein